jgi:hypothetical protein
MDNYDDDDDEFGDPETDPDAALLDHDLRNLLTDFPDSSPAAVTLPPGSAEAIAEALHRAWPDGHPPSATELATEDAGHGFDGGLSPLHGDLSGEHEFDFGHGDHLGDHSHSVDHHHPDQVHEHDPQGDTHG